MDTIITRQSVLDLLAGDWADYVARFQALSPAAQAAFLQQQGYKRLADLLAHIVAWWEVGMQAIPRFQSDPAARLAENTRGGRHRVSQHSGNHHHPLGHGQCPPDRVGSCA